MELKERFEIFLRDTNDSTPIHITLRGLVLHMLEVTAPRFYAAQNLKSLHDETLERCASITFEFDGDGDRLQACVDAWYLRHVRGLRATPPDRVMLKAALTKLEEDGFALYSWLLGEMAFRCGLDARLNIDPRDFKVDRTWEAYYLTHIVMLDTTYFAKPATHADANTWRDAIVDLIPWLTKKPNVDLAGEVALCLGFYKHPKLAEARALISNARPGENTHEQATVILGLAVE